MEAPPVRSSLGDDEHGRQSVVAAWGYNYYRQVSPAHEEQFLRQPVLVWASAVGDAGSSAGAANAEAESPTELTPVQVAAGGHFSAVLTATGRVFTWGVEFDQVSSCVSERLFPGRVQIVQIAAGKKHSAALSRDGQVFTWGCGFFGRLGHGSEERVTEPRRVEYLWKATRGLNPDGENVRGSVFQVACGGSHTGALLSDGSVFFWGFNRYYQCGRGHGAGDLLLPQRFDTKPLDSNECIASLYCGRQHSMLLTESGRVYAWGLATFGRLGHRNNGAGARSVSYPRKVDAFTGDSAETSVFKLALGATHTLALTCSGHVFAWGRNEVGQLGIGGHVEVQRTPVMVKLPHDIIVSDVQAASTHSLAIAAPRRGMAPATIANLDRNATIYAWGIGFGGGGSSPSSGFDTEDVWDRPQQVEQLWATAAGCQTHATGAALGDAHALFILEMDSASDAAIAATNTAPHPPRSESKLESCKDRLFALCTKGRLPSLHAELEEHPEMINAQDANGQTLLMRAAGQGRCAIVEMLLRFPGCAIDAQDAAGNTALHLAFAANALDVFELLRTYGADDTLSNCDGRLAYHGVS